MNELELKQSVKTEYQANVSSPQVERKLRQAYESLPDLPQKQKRPTLRVLRTAGAALGGLAAAFVLLVVVSTANPALAEAIPGMENLLSFLRGSGRGDPMLQAGAIPQYAQTVDSAVEEGTPGLQVTETYFDGQVLMLSTKLTLEDPPEGNLVLTPKYRVHFFDGEKELTPDYEIDDYANSMVRLSGNTFVGTLLLYPLEAGGEEASIDLPDSFRVTVSMDSLSAYDPYLMVLPEGAGEGPHSPSDYSSKEYTLEAPESFTCAVSKDDSLKKVYPVHETKAGCTLDQITVTPAWTEVKVTLSEELENPQTVDDAVLVRLYSSKGEKIISLAEMGSYISSNARQHFQTPVKDETGLTVKFFRRSNARTPIAEFTVPIEGGYDRLVKPAIAVDPIREVVYDPPCTERDPADMEVDLSAAQQLELDKPITLKGGYQGLKEGSIDMTLSNLRYYADWREAGIDDEDMYVSPTAKEKLDDMTFVMLDVTLSANDDAVFRSTDNTFWITQFADTMISPIDQLLPASSSNEIQYFSEHGIGFSDYYHFTLEPGETKTMQVGFLIPTEELEAEHFQIHGRTSVTNPYAEQGTSPEPPDEHYYYFTVPAPGGR